MEKQTIADAGAAISTSSFGVWWLADLTAILQPIALLVAIVSGGVTIYIRFIKKDNEPKSKTK